MKSRSRASSWRSILLLIRSSLRYVLACKPFPQPAVTIGESVQTLYSCSDCGHEFDSSFLGRCPKCRTPVADSSPASAPAESASARQWISTSDFIVGHEITESKGIVWAAISTMGMKKLGFSRQEERLEHAADGAIRELLVRAREMGGNAVIAVRLTANNAEGGVSTTNSTGVLASGTAVVVRPLAPPVSPST